MLVKFIHVDIYNNIFDIQSVFEFSAKIDTMTLGYES